MHGTHDQLTKRDDVRKTMEKYLDDDTVNFGLFQGCRAVSDDDKKVYFRALIFEVSSEHYDT